MRPKLNLNFFIAAALMIAVYMATSYFDSAQKPTIVTLEPPISDLARDPAPEALFTLTNGLKQDLAALKGRRVILNVWASWCAPCLVEMPQLLQIARENPDDLTLVLLSVDAEKSAIDPFFAKHGLRLPANALVAWDKDKAISKNMFGTVRYPETILIDTQGRLAKKISGAVDWATPEMMDTLKTLRHK